MKEQDAIQRMKRGDITGLETLVAQYQVKAVRAAMLITRDKALAEDVVQSTFIRMYERIHLFDESRSFAPYLMRSVANAAIQAVRQQQRTLSLNAPIGNTEGATFEEMLLDRQPLPLDAVEFVEQKEAVRDALDQLSPEQRAAIVMRYYLNMSESDMSDALDTPTGTIKWRLYQARKRLKGLLERALFSPSTIGGSKNG